MQLPYKRTIENLHRLHDMIVSGESRIRRVVLSRVTDGSPADAEFTDFVKATFPKFEVFLGVRGSWVGRVRSDAPIPNVGCARWFEISIMATGIVSHCCMDGNGDFPIGDVKTQHLLEIYNQPHYRQLRESTRSRRDAKPCDQCSFL
jgi:radical SAM protein with 4Fe4S-binding SPASM domain